MRLTADKHLHSREHLLADDLSREMLEPKKFAAYLGLSKIYSESDLRALAKRVLAKADLDPRNRGKYFFGALRSLPRRRLVRLRGGRRKRLDESGKNRLEKHHGVKNNSQTSK